MTRKETMDSILSRVPEENREALIEELRQAGSRSERVAVLEKYNVSLSEEEKMQLREKEGFEVTDEDLDRAAGGCCEWTCWDSSKNCKCGM